MYMKRMLEIGKATNGFVIECHVPIKEKEKQNSNEMCGCYPGSSEKQYIAKDSAEVSRLIDRLMPMLDGEFTSEEEFDAAFSEASGTKK